VNKYTLLLLSVFVFISSVLNARHYFRPYDPFKVTTPLALQSHQSNQLQFSTYAHTYARMAHETFLNHGTRRSPLSALVFGKDEFRLSHIFQNCNVPLNTEYYNPYMRILKMRPRIAYSEVGTHFGATIEARVGKTRKSRVGIRIDMPIKRREIERKDTGWNDSAQTQNVKIKQKKTITNSGGTVNKEKTVPSYRLDYLEAMRQTPGGTKSGVEYLATDVKVFDTSLKAATNKIAAATIYSPEGITPRGNNVGTTDTAKGTSGSQIDAYLPTGLVNLTEGNLYEIEAKDYAQLADNYSALTAAERIAVQDKKATIWLVPTYQNANANLDITTGSQAIFETFMDNIPESEFPNPYEWLYDRGYRFESDQAVGLGNMTTELFYTYDWSQKIMLHASTGFIMPTAAKNTSATNPYAVNLGNWDHQELFLRAGLTQEVFCPELELYLDARYTFVLTDTENQCATPVGAQIKNIGPQTTARVNWNYLTTDLNLTLFHPSNRNISVSIGYNLYYKTRDWIRFSTTEIESWLGRIYDSVSKTYITQNLVTLDQKVARQRTESIAHTLSVKGTYQPNPWLSSYAQCAYVVAGKNTPQDLELSVGCMIKF